MWVRFPPPALDFERLSTFAASRFGQDLGKKTGGTGCEAHELDAFRDCSNRLLDRVAQYSQEAVHNLRQTYRGRHPYWRGKAIHG